MIVSALAILVAASLRQMPDSTNVMSRVPLGSRVRIETRSVREESVEGTLVEKNQGFLRTMVGPRDGRGASVSVPWAQITSLSLDAGRERKSSAARGTLAGASAALVVTASLSNPTAAAAAGMMLPVAGGVVGWMMGFERWEPVLWRPAIDSVMEREATRIHLDAGTEIAVRVGRRMHRGVVAGVGDDSLTVRLRDVSRELGFALADVSELRLPAGRNRLRGAALGFSAMAIAAGIHIFAARPTDSEKPRILLGYAFGGAALGALIGAPGWRRLPLPVR
ncbi:MAG: hypothetical protein ACREOK_09535 [Gemmatimonadaceae bacterium]